MPPTVPLRKAEKSSGTVVESYIHKGVMVVWGGYKQHDSLFPSTKTVSLKLTTGFTWWWTTSLGPGKLGSKPLLFMWNLRESGCGKWWLKLLLFKTVRMNVFEEEMLSLQIDSGYSWLTVFMLIFALRCILRKLEDKLHKTWILTRHQQTTSKWNDIGASSNGITVKSTVFYLCEVGSPLFPCPSSFVIGFKTDGKLTGIWFCFCIW